MDTAYLIIDIDRCWGCKTCQVACKVEHGLTAEDFRPIEPARVERELDGQARCDFLPLTCMHCTDPACMGACLKKAIYRDEEGLIQVDAAKCVGCGLCASACPYGAIGLAHRQEKSRLAIKCDLCSQRRARGFLTSCEQHCLGGAITSCAQEDLEGLLAPFAYRWTVGQTIYVSSALPSLGSPDSGRP